MATSGEKREVKMTEKGFQLFESTCDEHKSKIDQAWRFIEDDIFAGRDGDKDIKTLRKCEKDMKEHLEKYATVAEEYRDFLSRKESDPARIELKRFSDENDNCMRIVKKSLEELRTLRMNLVDAASNISFTSSERKKKKWTELYKREAQLQKEKLRIETSQNIHRIESESKQREIDIDLTLLKKEKEEISDEDSVDSDLESVNLPHQPKEELVNTYLQDVQNTREHALSVTPEPNVIIPQPTPRRRVMDTIPQFVPRHSDPPPVQSTDQNNNVNSFASEISSALLRKQLIPERFSNFDNTAESYNSWKVSFLSIAQELKVTRTEELELLLNRLTGKSKDLAISIRNANPGQPDTALLAIWRRLDEMYGKPELIEASLRTRLQNFGVISTNDYSRLYDLLNILIKVESLKANPLYASTLAYFDSSTGVNPIVQKLPYNIQEKWITKGYTYKKAHGVPFPPFSEFVVFIRDMCAIRNDPAFSFRKLDSPRGQGQRIQVHARKSITETDDSRCPIHKANHSINECRSFREKSIPERKNFLISRHLCLRCCTSTKHIARDCRLKLKCDICKLTNHCTALHDSTRSKPREAGQGKQSEALLVNLPHGGEQTTSKEEHSKEVQTKCMTLCGDSYKSRSCSKTLLVDIYHKDNPQNVMRTYAILDDQSDQTLATPQLFNDMHITDPVTKYALRTCSGRTTVYGRRARGLIVRSIDLSVSYELPPVIECEDIPNNKTEIATPDIAKSYEHLNSIAPQIPELDPNSDIHLLIGRDLPEVHHVQYQILGKRGTPFGHKVRLGWSIIGEICLGRIHKRNSVTANKISVLDNGSVTCHEVCNARIHVKETIVESMTSPHDYRGDNVFLKECDDDRPGLSTEDRKFLTLMNEEYTKDEEGHWTAPLPFRHPPDNLPNNRSQALHQAHLLDANLRKDPVKKEQFVKFMAKVLSGGAAEVAPTSDPNHCWYLPLFGVYHPRKPHQIRGVFDSSAVYGGVSLNSILMSGPDMVNSLLGILLRFRRDEVAMTADVEQMFYRFHVNENHRDFLRFFWYRNNNPDDILIEYRMRSHVFGNSPSPAIAAYGLRKTVEGADPDVQGFVRRNFYVDDALISVPDANTAIGLMKRTQLTLRTQGAMRLHKITSNSSAVMEAFDSSDHGEELKEIDNSDVIHRSLGLCWDLKADAFIFTLPSAEKPFTRRGVLSTVNSLFDPIGFIAPIIISGKNLLREVTPEGVDWDEPLPAEHLQRWTEWQTSLQSLKDVVIPRMMSHTSITQAKSVTVHIFSDASEKAIASAAYIEVIDRNDTRSIKFLMGKGKLAPPSGHTVPRLELCGAALSTELAEIINVQLKIPLDSMNYYIDSKVVLGYISNRTRRFYTYVSNRVERILRFSSADQWHYVPSGRNPADSCTRCITSVIDIMHLPWIVGPQYLFDYSQNSEEDSEEFPLIDSDNDVEIRPLLTNVKSENPTNTGLGTKRFERLYTWAKVIISIVLLKRFLRKFKEERGPQLQNDINLLDEQRDAEICVLKEVQREHFSDDLQRLQQNKPLSKDSKICSLLPFLDDHGVMRVGGRINRASGQISSKEINPIILPKDSYISTLLITHFHIEVKHQGRLFTEGALRSGGYWIVGAKRRIASIIHNCVTCRKLRRSLETQKMSDVPIDRVTPGPPFTSVGIDVFGPWQVSTRKTRGGATNSKRWGVIFTCLTTRAIHIEVIEEMSSSSFINSLRRFLSIRGPVKCIRSDRGTNFVGASAEMNLDTVRVEDGPVRDFLQKSGITWFFNVPHASHMGGIWERMIGVTRRVLDAVLLENKSKPLTHETLTTFLSEVCAIVNTRPIVPISSDPHAPAILNPSMLLTGKVDFLPVVSDSLSIKDVYRAQWKHVQVLADYFWNRWRKEYLNTLQSCRKWTSTKPNLKPGDVVLMKNSAVHRNNWPMGIVENAIESDDGCVRKVVLRTIGDGKKCTFTRPIHELVLLM